MILVLFEDEYFNVSFHQLLMLSFSLPGTQTDFESATEKDLGRRSTENDATLTYQVNSKINSEPKGEILCFFRQLVNYAN